MSVRQHTYFVAIAWFILSLFSSMINDIISKYVGMRLHSTEVTFFRFLFGSIVLIPFIIYYGVGNIRTNHPFIHLGRGGLLFFGITAWTYGLVASPVTTGTVFSWTIPLFTLVLAVFFLKENIIWQRWLVTFVGFLGTVVTLNPNATDFNPQTLIFIISAVAFATLDIINKKFVVKESMLSMLFYSALVTALLALPTTIIYWKTPTAHELLLLFILGASANLILFFILKAFALAEITALAPYRYLELILSSIGAYIIFNELPSTSTLTGALILIPATLFVIYSEKRAGEIK